MADSTPSNRDANDSQYRIFRGKILAKFDLLTEREKRVLSLRFGLIDGYPRTLAEVGTHFKVDATRIREIETNALKRILAE